MKGRGAADAAQGGARVRNATTPRVAAQCRARVQQPQKVRINTFPRRLTLTPEQFRSRGDGVLLPKYQHHTLLIRAD